MQRARRRLIRLGKYTPRRRAGRRGRRRPTACTRVARADLCGFTGQLLWGCAGPGGPAALRSRRTERHIQPMDLRFIEHRDARVAEQLRGNAPPRHKRAREASVVHRPASARRAFRFEHGHPAIGISQLLQAAACAKMEGLRDIVAVCVHHAHRTGPRDDLARQMRHGKAPCNFRAYGNELVATAELHHRVRGLRGPVVTTRPAQQAGAHGDGRRCVRGFLHTGIIAPEQVDYSYQYATWRVSKNFTDPSIAVLELAAGEANGASAPTHTS